MMEYWAKVKGSNKMVINEIVVGLIAAFAAPMICMAWVFYQIRKDPLEDVYW